MPRRHPTAFCSSREVLLAGSIAGLTLVLLASQLSVGGALSRRTCIGNLHDISVAAKLYALDHGGNYPRGTYGGLRNWEVNPDVDPTSNCLDYTGIKRGYIPPQGGTPYTGCAYGMEFYRELMQVQMYPYQPELKIWYCPQDRFRLPDRANVARGAQSYQWFPNWVYNVCDPNFPFPCVRYPNGTQVNLNAIPPTINSAYQDRRILFGERGMFGWDGPTASPPTAFINHPAGYNVVYFDGHAGTIAYGDKWKTLPASGWPPSQAPR